MGARRQETGFTTGTMKRNVDLQSANIDPFNGDPRDCMRFRTEFRNIFETTLDQGSSVYSAADKLNALYRFCTGDARQAIEDCRMGELNETAYKTAWDILYDNFGRPLYIVGAFIDELTSKDPVDTNDLQ